MTATETEETSTPYNFGGSAAVAVLVGVVLAAAARSGATQLLVAVAAVQALVAFALVLGLRIPGRNGALVVAGLAAAGSDVAVSLYPHSRLGPLLVVVALAVSVLFVHQLTRGAARVRVFTSLGGIALTVLCMTSIAALLQIRHEFDSRPGVATNVAFAVALSAAAALLVGYFVDMVVAAPRFDEDVPRGLLGVIASAAVGAAVAELALGDLTAFDGGRALFAGAAIGVVAALLGIAVSFVEHGAAVPEAGFARRARVALSVLVPISLTAPVAFVVLLAIRT